MTLQTEKKKTVRRASLVARTTLAQTFAASNPTTANARSHAGAENTAAGWSQSTAVPRCCNCPPRQCRRFAISSANRSVEIATSWGR